MACADIPLVIQRSQEKTEAEDEAASLVRYYQPKGPLLASAQRPLHALLQKQPAMLGAIQMVNGLFSFAMEIVLSLTVPMTESLYVLLRISFLTGPLFFLSGLLTNLLCKYPRLLPVCSILNWAGIVMATLELAILAVDLSREDPTLGKTHLMLELVETCVMGMNLLLCVILGICISSERRRCKQFLNDT